MNSEKPIHKGSSNPTNGTIENREEDGSSGIINTPPRFGRSRIFAKEELMYAPNNQPENLQKPRSTKNLNPDYRSPLPKISGDRNTKSQECSNNFDRKTKVIGSRRVTKKVADRETLNPLERYENALLRYRKPCQINSEGLRKDRREPTNLCNDDYSSSDSERGISRCQKSKSTSSIDTQSINNILDEYEDLDYERSSDVSESGSISVTNYQAVMDKRKEKQLKERRKHLEKSNKTNIETKNSKEYEIRSEKNDEGVKIDEEKMESVFKVNQQTQVRQKSRDTINKLNLNVEEAAKSNQDKISMNVNENRILIENRSKPVAEILLRKGEVQKRVDEWLNQAQSQNFSGSKAKRETNGRIVSLVRSSSNAEPKNSRRCRNDSRSRSTDETSGERLNGTTSYDDINRTESGRNERKLDRTKNIYVNPNKGTYKDYLAVKKKSRLGMDYGFGGQFSGRTIESNVGTSKIPQRGNVTSNYNSRRLNVIENIEVTSSNTEGSIIKVEKKEKHLSRSVGMTDTETRINGISVKTKTEMISNGRVASFKRSRSRERNTGILSSRVSSVLIKEDQNSSFCSNSRMRSGQCKQQLVSKGQLVIAEQQQEQETTSVNKVDESRSLLAADHESRLREATNSGTCELSDESRMQQRAMRDEKERNNLQNKSETNIRKFIVDSNLEVNESEKMIHDKVELINNSGYSNEQPQFLRPDRTKLSRSKIIRENSNDSEVRKPPAPPRRDHSKREKIELTSNVEETKEEACSSFKPAKRMYSAFCQLNEINSFTRSSGDPVKQISIKSHYATPKQVEKIEKRSIDPDVIHADDLESILKPVVRVSAYGENPEMEMMKSIETDLLVSNENYEVKAEDSCGERISIEAENVRNENAKTLRYPEIGLDQCLKLQRRNPIARNTNNEIPVERRVLPTKRWDRNREMNNQPVKTFGTFQTVVTNNCEINERRDETNTCKVKKNCDEAVIGNSCEKESTHQEPDLIPKTKLSIAKSYEARSTLRLDRNQSDADSRDLENEKIRKASFLDDIQSDSCHIFNSKPKNHQITTVDTLNLSVNSMDNKIIDVEEKKCKAVVNEVLVKNLRFQQDLPNNESSQRGPSMSSKPFNFNSVLSDDYDKIQAGDCPVEMPDDCQIFVTKEETERQKLIDLLKKNDYKAVKLELERSYTLSTPGGESPICCPPCSPPPAPAAYISSVRASSRRLATGNGFGGPTSPDRDPLGRLLRYLKTFYRELGTRDPRHLPPWASPLPLGTLCPAHFQPHLQLIHKSEQEHRLENIKIDQIFAPVRLSDGTISEAPRRVAVEGGPGSGRTTLCLRLLHQWSTQGDGPALAFMVPLRELRGAQLLNYLARDLFPRTSSLGDAISQVWRTLHLMEDRVLFVLDGYDECLGGRSSLGDAADLLEARLFPDAKILVTCSSNDSSTLSSLVQRRIHLAGLEWSHVERLCVAYFIHNDLADRACEFLESLNVQSTSIKQLVQHPLGWLMLCTLYQDSGSLPIEPSALVQAAIKCIVRRSLDRPVPRNDDIPGHCRKKLEDFGKLSLAALREGRFCYTEGELRSRGGGIEITRLGFLSRGLTFGQRRKADIYTPIHLAIAEFLAAYYLTSIAQYANILRRELEGLPSGIIGHLAGLLGPKTYLILNQLCPLEIPSRMVFSLLKAAGPSDGNISAVCRLVGAGPGFGPAPNDRPSAPLVQTSPLELQAWTKILESSACTLEALEVVFQIERGADCKYLNAFFDALAANESVKLVRITSLLGQEFPPDETQRLAGYLKCVLGKKRLNDFEVVVTCLEESAHDRLECVVNSLCRGLGHASNNLARLVLDMNLSGDQVSRVCEALRNCVQVQALHLPHLSCGCEGLASVAELLKERPLLALNLAGSWGAKNEDPSSSGISMGSGSGSSGCASSTLGTLPLNRCYSSLPRGALTAYGSMTRPATLPRLPLGLGLGPNPGNGNGPLPTNDRDRDSNGSSKRNSDSVLCHRLPLMHPLPTCDVTSHQGTGFHEIFNAIREPNCKLRSLNVSKCLQGSLDASCLGETIRRAKYLDALRASGASRPTDVMPLVLALTEAPCLQLLDLASPRLALDDHPSRLLCHALARNSTLRLLSLEGWTFRIEESESLAVFSELLMCTSVRELNLCNARLHLAVHEGPLSRLGRRDDAGAELLRAAPPPACPAIVFLRLAGFQVTVNDRPALRGPLLLPFLAGFTALSELDLSLEKSEIGGSSCSLLFIDDKILQHFFACLSSNLRNLQSLRINYWRVNLEESERTIRQISKNLKLSNLSFLKANGLIVTDSVKKIQIEHLFLQTILTNLQNLTWLCLDGMKITDCQASSIGKSIRDRYPGIALEISAKDINVKSVKALVAAVEEGERANVIYSGGSCCRIKITKIQKNAKGKKK